MQRDVCIRCAQCVVCWEGNVCMITLGFALSGGNMYCNRHLVTHSMDAIELSLLLFSLPPSLPPSLLPQNCLIQMQTDGSMKCIVADFGLAAKIKQSRYKHLHLFLFQSKFHCYTAICHQLRRTLLYKHSCFL